MSPPDRLSREEEVRLSKLAQSKDKRIPQEAKEAARNRVVNNVAGMAWLMAYKAAGRNDNRASDFFQEAMLTLVAKFHKFKPELGNRYITYATYWIRQAIRRYMLFKEALLHVPADYKDDSRLGEEGVAARRVKYGRYVDQAKRCISLDAIARNGNGKTANEIVASKEEYVGDVVDASTRAAFVAEVLSKMPSREREILLSRAEGKTLNEIGAEKKLTRERVRQLEMNARRHFKLYAKTLDSTVLADLLEDGEEEQTLRRHATIYELKRILLELGHRCTYEEAVKVVEVNNLLVDPSMFRRAKQGLFNTRKKNYA